MRSLRLVLMTAVPALLFVPLLALGTTFKFGDGGGLGDYLVSIQQFINGVIVPFLVAIAALAIFYGAFLFIVGAGDEDKRKKGKDYVVYGIAGMVVIFILWGLITLLVDVTGLRGTDPLDPPTIIPGGA